MQPDDATFLDADVLVIGGGLAGCWAAMRAAEHGARVILVDKGYISRAGCSPMSGGVMTGPTPQDDLDSWAAEFVRSGGYMNNQEWLEVFLEEQVERIAELDRLGPVLIKEENGSLRRIRSRGMTNVRCLQFNPKATMALLREALVRLGCTIIDRLHVVDLLTASDGAVIGAIAFGTRTGEPFVLRAKATVITSGPFNIKGRNVVDNVGADGHALAYRVGADLTDMEFAFGGTFSLMQRKYKFPAYNVALGHGAQLINAAGERFMQRYDPQRFERSELPQVIAAYLNEILTGRGPVYIDLRHTDENFVGDLKAVRGETWANELISGRIKDYRTRPVLIEPQWTVWSHRCGIRIDLDCRASVAGLYAAGSVVKNEAMGTHASAGSPTAFCNVAGARAGTAAADYARSAAPQTDTRDQVARVLERLRNTLARTTGIRPNEAFAEIRAILGTPLDCMVLSAERIAEIKGGIEALRQRCEELVAPDAHELVKAEEARAFLEAFDLSMAAAAARTESRESFYRTDYPYTDNVGWFCWHIAKKTETGPVFRRERIPNERYARPIPALPERILSPLARNLEEALHG
jgi:succinate dehydrogenase/fumarate reductase flavoprotein subunit